jgi:hypothetical protein
MGSSELHDGDSDQLCNTLVGKKCWFNPRISTDRTRVPCVKESDCIGETQIGLRESQLFLVVL